MSELAILVPVLRRPHRVEPLLKAFRATTPPARLLFICDPDDADEIAAIEREGAEFITLAGNYAEKIRAGVEATTESLLFLGADDLQPEPGWLKRAKAHLTEKTQVVGVNDMCSERVKAGNHATHFLLTREYALRPLPDGRPGPLCDLYDHSYVDDELVGTARRRGAIAFATDSIVRHLHPDNGTAEWDETYAKGRAMIRQDRRLFRERRSLWT